MAPGSRAAFPGDHRVATMPRPGWEIDTWTKIPSSAATRAGAWIREDDPKEGVFPGGPGWKGSTYPRSCKAATFLFKVCPSLAMMTSRLLVLNSRGMSWLSRLQASRSLEHMTDGLRTLCQPMFCGLKGRRRTSSPPGCAGLDRSRQASAMQSLRTLTRAWRFSISGEARRPGRHRSDARPHSSACELPRRPPAAR